MERICPDYENMYSMGNCRVESSGNNLCCFFPHPLSNAHLEKMDWQLHYGCERGLSPFHVTQRLKLAYKLTGGATGGRVAGIAAVSALAPASISADSVWHRCTICIALCSASWVMSVH